MRRAPGGLTRTQLSEALGRNQKADRINRSLALIERNGLARVINEGGGPGEGRPVERWFATTPGGNSSISSISFARDVVHATESADTAVATLRYWYGVGALDILPEHIPGEAGERARYSDRACLIGLVKAILDSVPWSLTAQDRAMQFVTVLTPLIEGGAA